MFLFFFAGRFNILDTLQSWNELLDIVIFAAFTDFPSDREHHALRLEDGLGHGVCDPGRDHVPLVSAGAPVVTAALPRHPAVQQLLPVGAAHRPVGEAGAAREEVDADPGQDDGRRRDVELLRIWVWV